MNFLDRLKKMISGGEPQPAADASPGLADMHAPKLGPRDVLGGVPGGDRLLAALPQIDAWIDQTLAQHAEQARPLASLGFARLGKYFPADFLEKAKVVVVDSVPIPPLASFGLPEMAAAMPAQAAGITYKDTFFVYTQGAQNESLHFHEAVHVVQWERLGAERFLALYALGIAQHGYRHSPLEETAYGLQERFDRKSKSFDAMAAIERDLAKLLASL